ncbi:MAG: GPP34 family phosphoprotein [Bacteroidales bacterium]|nr:GPP34 family phosphoprotein [Bacteroidales bacterium]
MDKKEKKSDLTFLQKIVLLALDDKGWFGSTEHKIKFGLVGAILFELYQSGRIRIANVEVTVINAKSTDDVILDRVLNLIKSSKKPRSLRSWIQRIVYKKLLLRKTVLKQLLQKKVISKEEFSLLVVFYQTKFPLLNVELKRKLQEQIIDSIVSGKTLTDQEVMLLVVMNNCKMVRKNFGGYLQYIKLRGRINEITQFKTPETESQKVFKLLQTAISRAIMASNVSIHV